MEQRHGDHHLQGEAEQGVWQEGAGEPGDGHQEAGGEVEGEQEGGEGARQQDLHPVHAVVPWQADNEEWDFILWNSTLVRGKSSNKERNNLIEEDISKRPK